MRDFPIASLERSESLSADDMTQDQPGAVVDRRAPDGVSMNTGSMFFERSVLRLEASDHASRLQVYQGQVESLQAQLNGLQAQFMKISSGIAGRIAGLEQELAAIRSLLASALPEGQTGMLEARKAGLNSQLLAFRRDEHTHETSTSFTVGALKGVQADIESLARAIEGQLHSIEARVQALRLI